MNKFNQIKITETYRKMDADEIIDGYDKYSIGGDVNIHPVMDLDMSSGKIRVKDFGFNYNFWRLGGNREVKTNMLYKIGQRFLERKLRRNYILSRSSPCLVSLISLDDGNRYVDAIEVNDPFAITEEEFNNISGKHLTFETFELIS